VCWRFSRGCGSHFNSLERHDSFVCGHVSSTRELKWLWITECGVAATSSLLTIIDLFCKRTLSKRRYSAKETYDFKEPANRSHHILCKWTHASASVWVGETPAVLGVEVTSTYTWFVPTRLLRIHWYILLQVEITLKYKILPMCLRESPRATACGREFPAVLGGRVPWAYMRVDIWMSHVHTWMSHVHTWMSHVHTWTSHVHTW